MSLNHTHRQHRTQLREEAQRLRAVEDAAARDNAAVTRFNRSEQLKLALAAFDEDLRAALGLVEILDLPLAETRFERDRCARRNRDAMRVLQQHRDLRRAVSVGELLRLRQDDVELRQLVRHQDEDGFAPALVAERIELHDFELVCSRRERDADELPDFEPAIGDRGAAPQPVRLHFLAIDLEGKHRAEQPFHPHGGLGHRQRHAVAEVHKAQGIVQIRERKIGPA